QAAPLAPVCGYSVVTQTTLAGKANGHGKGLVHNKHMTASTTSSLQANGQSCGVGQPGTQQQTQQVQASQQTQVQASQQQTQQTQVQASQQHTQQTQGQASQSAT